MTLCQSCGAPLQVPPDGQAVRCHNCSAENVVAARVEGPVAEQWSEDELRRLAHLSAQPREFSPDPANAPFFAGMRPSRSAGPAAFAQWQRTRATLRPGDLGTERAFTQLTLLLAWQAAEDADPVRERGLLESALGAARDQRFLGMLRAALAVLACRMGDHQGAEAWLAACDPRPADLRADSHYRMARAFIDTAAGRSSRVLSLLGGNDVEVPIVDELAGACALMRAHAWERLGRVETAVDLLVHYSFEGDPFGQQVARSFSAVNRQLSLCAVAAPRAEAVRLRSLGRRRIGWTKGMVAVLALALSFLVGAAFLLLLAMGAMAGYGADSAALAILFALIDLFVVGMFAVILMGAWRRTRRQRAVLAFGEIAPARMLRSSVISSSATHTNFAATIAVYPDHAPPKNIELTIGSSPERYAELASGKPFTARHHGSSILIEPVLR